MNCCFPDTSEEIAASGAERPLAATTFPTPRRCPRCQGTSRPITRRTILLMIEASRLEQVGEARWRFCTSPACRVVYFAEEGEAVITTEALRVRVGLKERTDPIPLCYCFGFDEADARTEIAQTGCSTIPQRIAAFIKQGLCACETKNPSGGCCLGEVNQAIRRLSEGSPQG